MTIDGHGTSRMETIDGHGTSRMETIDGHGPSRMVVALGGEGIGPEVIDVTGKASTAEFASAVLEAYRSS